MNVKYKGRIYESIATGSFGLDDLVMINSIVGFVDFIGGDQIVLWDENDLKHDIPHCEIKNIYLLAVFIVNSTHRFVIEPKSVSHGKTNCYDNDRK